MAFLAVIEFPTTRARAASILSAKELIDAIDAEVDGNRTAEKKGLSPADAFRSDLQAFREEQKRLSDQVAAARWLEFVDRYQQQHRLRYYYPSGATVGSFEEVLKAIPGPDTWWGIREAVLERQRKGDAGSPFELGLRLIVGILTNDADMRDAVVGRLRERHETLTGIDRENHAYYLVALNSALGEMTGDRESQFVAFVNELNELTRFREWEGILEVPDLVSLVGRERSRALLTELVLHEELFSEFPVNTPTFAFAQEIARERLEEVKLPQWGLAIDVEAADLYEHFVSLKKARSEAVVRESERLLATPGGDESDEEILDIETYDEEWDEAELRAKATWSYVFHLVLGDRLDEAINFYAERSMEEVTEYFSICAEVGALGNRRQEQQIFDFLTALLTRFPAVELWDEWTTIAARLGEANTVVERAMALLEKESLSSSERQRVVQHLPRALLMADRHEEAVERLQLNVEGYLRHDRLGYYELLALAKAGLQVFELGRVTERADWQTLGSNWVEASVKQGLKVGPSLSVWLDVIGALMEFGKVEKVWEIAFEELIAKLKVQDSGRPGDYRALAYGWLLGEKLIRVFYERGQYDDVIYFLERFKHLGVADVVSCLSEDEGRLSKFHGMPIGYIVARSLMETGQNDAAQKVLDAMLLTHPKFDGVYELYVELRDHEACLERFAELGAQFPFEDRPLIWSGVVLKNQGKLDEAEAVLRRAITLDPSDGEQRQGDRMRAYSVLLEVMRQKGNAEEADTFERLVATIRLAERADGFYKAGLLGRAVAIYRESLGVFADEYSVHARLALLLSERGQQDEAAVHFKNAFELMPDSLGRAGWLCIGCEGIFEGKQAQSVAERVFQQVVQENPDNPQAHYLLGVLREEQGRRPEAVASFTQAVALDPDHLNAWNCLTDTESRVLLSTAERDAVAFNVLRLEPRRSYLPILPTQVSNLAELWRILERNESARIEPPESVLPFFASQAELKRRLVTADEFSRSRLDDVLNMGRIKARRQRMSPRNSVMEHSVIRAVLPLMSSGGK